MRIPYRTEIDGLRAIAVAAVVIYHANFIAFGYPLFQGGFIGVDIFFVISGYLITGLILNEIYQTNKFSFKDFYERRIRRILPALLFVIMISLIVGYFFLLPNALSDLVKSIISIIFLSSNLYFNFIGTNYGQEDNSLKPALHTWSLSVEEQFYILFPIFLLIIFKFFRNHLFNFLFLGFCLSLIFAEYFSKNHPGFSFYQLPTRGFELLLGSILSYFELSKTRNIIKSYSILNKICPSIGMILILYSFIFFNYDKIFHPGIITLIPIIGVALIVWFSGKGGGLITKILSSKILVFFGLISYSLYLWHYPIFAYLRYIDLFDTLQIKLLSIILVIILSILSYYFIEKPFRNKNIVSTNLLITYILTSTIILLSFSFYTLKTEGFKKRFPSILIEDTGVDFISRNPIYSRDGKINILLIGDSHSRAIQYNLNDQLKRNDFNLFYFHTNIYLENFNLIDKKTKIINEKYFEENKKISEFIKNNNNLIIILSSDWVQYIQEYSTYLEPINNNSKSKFKERRQEYLTEGLKSIINKILKQGHTVILIYQVPSFPFNPAREILKQNSISVHEKSTILNILKFKKELLNVPILSNDYESYKKNNQKVFEILDNIKGFNIYRVYPHEFFCNTIIANRCVANNKEHLFFGDSTHLTFEGSKYVVNDIMKIIKKIETKKN